MKKLYLIIAIILFAFGLSAQETSTFTDKRDGKTYKTVKIALQTWMAENLAFKADSNCWTYDNDQSNVAKYGYLYNWATAKKVCPAGWHLPSKEEFETLINNYGGNADAAYNAFLPGGTSGFSAQFGGYSSKGNYYSIGEVNSFWSSSPDNGEYVWGLDINSEGLGAISYEPGALMSGSHRSCGFSVRCLLDN